MTNKDFDNEIKATMKALEQFSERHKWTAPTHLLQIINSTYLRLILKELQESNTHLHDIEREAGV